jgi:hypothetical protein
MTESVFTKARILLAEHSAVLEKLRELNVVRSKNNPTGDYAEWLVSECLNLVLEKNSSKGYDATGRVDGLHYQIKGRRITSDNKSTQLGVIRNLDESDFDFLIAVIFKPDWEIAYAAKIPRHVVCKLKGNYRQHVNGFILRLPRTIFEKDPNIENITDQLRNQGNPPAIKSCQA